MNKTAPGKILIVDDNPDNLKVLSEQLDVLNYDIRVARDGVAAWDSIQADAPDLILLDILMPRMDGYKFCRRLKKDERYAKIPVIFITGLGDSFNKVKGFQVGAVDYIVKPFETEEVRARVKSHLESYLYQKELRTLQSELENRIEERAKELKQSEANLRAFIDSSQDTIGARDLDGKLIFWNKQYADTIKAEFGVELQVGMGMEDYLSEKDVKMSLERRLDFKRDLKELQQGKTTSKEYSFQYPSSEIRFLKTTYSPIMMNNKLIGVADITRDVTEQKAAREQLLKAEEKYRTVANFTYDWEYWENTDGKMIYISPSFERITGYPVQKLLDDSSFLKSMILREDRKKWDSHIKLHAEKKSSEPIQFRIKRKDGTIRWIEHVCQPVSDEEGKSLGVRASNRDISDRKIAEMGLVESERQLRLITDSLPVLIAYVGRDRCYKFCNQAYAQWFNREVEQLVGCRVGEILGAELSEKVAPFAELALSGETVHFETDLSKKGKKYPFEVTYVPNVGADSLARGFFVLAQDVSIRKQKEMELQRHRRELTHIARLTTMGELTASIAHQLNQPLTAILSNAQAALRFLDVPEPDLTEIRSIFEDIVQDDKRAGQVISRLRSFLSRGELEMRKWDLKEVIKEVVTLVQSDAVIRNVTIDMVISPTLPMALFDRIQIQQVLLNLIINGMEAMKETPIKERRLTIQTDYQASKEILVAIKDSGCGITPAEMEQIFSPFFTTKTNGMGLGLSINQSIIQSHNGRIWAENNLNQGATFYIALPLSQE